LPWGVSTGVRVIGPLSRTESPCVLPPDCAAACPFHRSTPAHSSGRAAGNAAQVTSIARRLRTDRMRCCGEGAPSTGSASRLCTVEQGLAGSKAGSKAG
jgi:hypothetical protein